MVELERSARPVTGSRRPNRPISPRPVTPVIRPVTPVIRQTRPTDREPLLEIARSLPEWFTPGGLAALEADSRAHPGLVAELDGQGVGFVLYRVSLPDAEILWMGVARTAHRRGIGRALVDDLIARLAADGARSVSVDTLGDSVEYEPYARTRAFYRGLGFADTVCLPQDDPEWPERLTLTRTIR